jgi:hypothetical protein
MYVCVCVYIYNNKPSLYNSLTTLTTTAETLAKYRGLAL